LCGACDYAALGAAFNLDGGYRNVDLARPSCRPLILLGPVLLLTQLGGPLALRAHRRRPPQLLEGALLHQCRNWALCGGGLAFIHVLIILVLFPPRLLVFGAFQIILDVEAITVA